MYSLPQVGPIISFTFDDFPRSALLTAGPILAEAGARATYYVSFGLVGQTTPTGLMFVPEDVQRAVSEGHELGCHTYHHFPAWETPVRRYTASVQENANALANRQLAGARAFASHSYPISYPRPQAKRVLAKRFLGLRGGGQTFNVGQVDLNYLNSFFLEQSTDNFSAVEQVIAANQRASGWLVFSTHDVAAHHTRFGCTPEFFQRTVAAAARSGARLLPVSAALAALGVKSPAS